MSTKDLKQQPNAIKRRRRHVFLSKPAVDYSVLKWDGPINEDSDICKVWAWYSKCKRYKIARVQSNYDHEALYFVCLKQRVILTCDKSRLYSTYQFIHETEMGRPKEYKSLEGAINICELDAGLPSDGKGDVLHDAVTLKIERCIIEPKVNQDGTPVKKGGKPKETLYGHPITAVLRWMGQDFWDFDEAKTALSWLKCKIADATIHAQLRAGRKGERGPPAPITDGQAKELYEIVN